MQDMPFDAPFPHRARIGSFVWQAASGFRAPAGENRYKAGNAGGKRGLDPAALLDGEGSLLDAGVLFFFQTKRDEPVVDLFETQQVF
jgi:hypothetical protein